MRKAIRVMLILGATAVGAIVIAVLFLVMREGESKDTTIAKAVSPDGQRRLELHQVIAPVHGGPDRFQITLGDVSSSFGDTVYSHEFECADFKGFRIWWTDSTHADVEYGLCDTGHPEGKNMSPPPPLISWKNVTIALHGSGGVTTH